MKTWMLASGLVLALGSYGAWAADPSTGGDAAQSAPDNTGRNVRDRQDGAITPMQQSNAPADVELTKKIRQAVVADNGLSTNAHNVKIIASEGVVTLRGPVNSADEKAKIEQTAERIAGAKKVHNYLEVTAQ
jgi:osmotically-inducible protein OsmY